MKYTFQSEKNRRQGRKGPPEATVSPRKQAIEKATVVSTEAVRLDLAPFLDALRREGKSPNTVICYEDALQDFERWWQTENGPGAMLDAKAVTVHDVRGYRGHLIKVRRQAAATVNRKLSALSSFFRIALARGLTQVDPTAGVEGLRHVRPAPRALDRKAVHRLLRSVYAAQNRRDIAILELLLNSGIRIGELAKLALDDVAIMERKGHLVVRSGKGDVSRTVPLNSDARRALREYLAVRPETAAADFFISQKRGGGISVSNIWRVVKKYGLAAGVELSPHALRHTFGTRMVREHGTDLVLVARLMGHQDVNTTARYAEPSEEDLADAVEALAAE